MALLPKNITKLYPTKDRDANSIGPKVLIIGGVHGNEKCGVDAIKEILEKQLVKLTSGMVTFVIANQAAIDRNVRFVQEDLNRCFLLGKHQTNSYEETLAQDLKGLMYSHDFLLDIHASTSPESQPFMICEPNAYPYLKDMPIQKVCSGFDTIQPGGTDYYMNQIGKIGVCLECGYLGQTDVKRSETCKNVAITGVLTFLRNLKIVDYQPPFSSSVCQGKPEHYVIEWMYQTKPTFKLAKNFPDFYHIKKDEIIGYHHSSDIDTPYTTENTQERDADDRKVRSSDVARSPDDGILLFCNNILPGSTHNEAFVWGKPIII